MFKPPNYNQAMKCDLLPEAHLGLIVERRVTDVDAQQHSQQQFVLEYLPFRTPEEVFAYMAANGLEFGDKDPAGGVFATALVAASPVKLKVSIDIEPL